MKKVILMIASLVATVLLAGPSLIVAPPNGHIHLSWGVDDTNDLSTNLWFNVYETTNMTTPFTNWNFLTNTIGTNLEMFLDVAPGQHFFVMTSSNFWMETSITSNMCSTPPLPKPINNSVKINKAD